MQRKKAALIGLRHMENQNMFDRVVEREDNLRLAIESWQRATGVSPWVFTPFFSGRGEICEAIVFF